MDLTKLAEDDVPVGRQKLAPSLASDIIRTEGETQRWAKADYSLPYLFMRMGKINRAAWKNYVIGFVAACSTYFFYMILL
jgi:ATP-binding cassette subfamily B (MDR/TAP) protein 1